MKNFLLVLISSFTFSFSFAQGVICNANGNLVIFSNYDGGMLTINVDVNIPNLKIGIVSYEADSINLTGPFVNNVTEIEWAGYNGTNQQCAIPVIPTTTINGAPGSATTTISLYPNSPLTNLNGYNIIICNYSCDINSNQGGCNTADQIEAYFLQQFPGSTIYSHFTQYNCWSSAMNISDGGNCCGAAIPFAVASNSSNVSCSGSCNGTATAIASGGQSPYNYLWTNGATTSTINNLCAGNYIVTVTDAGTNSSTQSITISSPLDILFEQNFTECEGYSLTVGTNTYSTSGIYIDIIQAANGCDSTVKTTLTINSFPVISTEPVDQTILSGGNALFVVVANSTNATYQWQVNSGAGFTDITNTTPYTGANNDSLTVTNTPVTMDSFIYRCLISLDNCADTTAAAFLIVNDFDAAPILNSSAISIYPNPTDENIFIAGFVATKIIVLNKLGHLVLVKHDVNVLSLENFPSGIYFIRLFDEKGIPVITEKVMRE